ncbi:MAG: GNAT family protein [Fimbriimonadaceae bacterium]
MPPILFEPRATILAGTRITLTPIENSHFSSLCQIALEPDIWTWMLNAPPTTEIEFRAIFDQMVELKESGSQMPFVVTSNSDGRTLGCTRLFDFRASDRALEIGYTWYAFGARGTLVNQEAKVLLLTHCFDELDANRVQLKTDARNARSRRAIEKIGAKFEGILRNYQRRHDGTCRDTAMFSIIPEDWPAAREVLRSRLSDEG